MQPADPYIHHAEDFSKDSGGEALEELLIWSKGGCHITVSYPLRNYNFEDMCAALKRSWNCNSVRVRPRGSSHMMRTIQFDHKPTHLTSILFSD